MAHCWVLGQGPFVTLQQQQLDQSLAMMTASLQVVLLMMMELSGEAHSMEQQQQGCVLLLQPQTSGDPSTCWLA
jgi:hypothetical protein